MTDNGAGDVFWDGFLERREAGTPEEIEHKLANLAHVRRRVSEELVRLLEQAKAALTEEQYGDVVAMLRRQHSESDVLMDALVGQADALANERDSEM